MGVVQQALQLSLHSPELARCMATRLGWRSSMRLAEMVVHFDEWTVVEYSRAEAPLLTASARQRTPTAVVSRIHNARKHHDPDTGH